MRLSLAFGASPSAAASVFSGREAATISWCPLFALHILSLAAFKIFLLDLSSLTLMHASLCVSAAWRSAVILLYLQKDLRTIFGAFLVISFCYVFPIVFLSFAYKVPNAKVLCLLIPLSKKSAGVPLGHGGAGVLGPPRTGGVGVLDPPGTGCAGVLGPPGTGDAGCLVPLELEVLGCLIPLDH